MLSNFATRPASGIDFLLITALPEERDAVLSRLANYRKIPPIENDIQVYFFGEIPVTFSDNSSGNYQIITVCLPGMGRVQAATATKNAIQQWNPRYIILVGIAGGIASRNIHLGDILIADQIIDYEPQKITPNGVESRWDVYRTDVRLFNAYNNFQSEKWQNKLNYYRLKAIGLMGE